MVRTTDNAPGTRNRRIQSGRKHGLSGSRQALLLDWDQGFLAGLIELRWTSYSVLSACIGSTEAARRAGMMEAESASRNMEIAASTITTGSSGST